MKQILLNITLLLAVLTVFSQQQTVKYPYYVLPGKKYLVKPQNDTLWVITHSQLKQTIKVAKQNKIYLQQIEKLKKIKDTLKLKNSEQDSLIKIYKADRDFYEQKYNEAEADLTKCFDKGKKQKTYFKIAVGTGIALSVATFFLGAYLFH